MKGTTAEITELHRLARHNSLHLGQSSRPVSPLVLTGLENALAEWPITSGNGFHFHLHQHFQRSSQILLLCTMINDEMLAKSG